MKEYITTLTTNNDEVNEEIKKHIMEIMKKHENNASIEIHMQANYTSKIELGKNKKLLND